MDPVAKWFWGHWRHNSELAPVIERNGEYLFFPYGMFRRGFKVSKHQKSTLDKLVGKTNQICFWLFFVIFPSSVFLNSVFAILNVELVIILLVIAVYSLTLAFLINYEITCRNILHGAEIASYIMTLHDHFSLINRDVPSFRRIIIGLIWNATISIIVLFVVIYYFNLLRSLVIFSLLAILIFPLVFTAMLTLYLRRKLQERKKSASS